jgi:hypothetical protein
VSAPQEQVQQALPTRIPKRWPLVNKLQARAPGTPLTKDARLINCYAEYDPEDKEYWVYKRLGLSPSVYSTSTPNYPLGCGMFTHPGTGNVWMVAQQGGFSHNAGLWHLNAASSSAALTMPLNVPTPVWWETVNSNPQTVVVSTGAEAWTINVNSLVATKITNVNYPAVTVPGWAYLDGTLYTMDPSGVIWGSALNDATTWTALNNISASSNADMGVALVKCLNYIIAFKQYTAQVFYDNGPVIAGGTALAPVPDSQMPLGCFCANSVQAIDNSVLWVTANQLASPQIAQMDNLTPRIVSTPAVERVLDNIFFSGGWLGTVYIPQATVWSWVLKHGGHRFYGLTFVSNNITLIYDLDQQLWYIWTDPNGNYWPIVSTAAVPPTLGSTPSIHYAQHINNGNIYQLDGDYSFPNDFGTVFPVDIYTPNMDFGTNRRKTLKALYFNGDKVPSRLSVRYSDDDYQTFSNPRLVDMNLKKPRLTDCGTFHRRRAYHIRHQANTAFRLRTIDLQMDLGTL